MSRFGSDRIGTFKDVVYLYELLAALQNLFLFELAKSGRYERPSKA